MVWSKKKSDPVSERAQALTSEIAALEAQIKRLDDQLHHAPANPRLRSTAVPHGATINHPHTVAHTDAPEFAPAAATHEPVFEHISQERITQRNEMPNLPEHFNEFGVRKYDFPALIRRLRVFFTGPSTSNPKLVNYLAAGGVQGLRPLRKEKRVARNRFVLFSALLFTVLFGTLWWYFRNR
jgi:cell division protein FtsB